MEFRIAKNQISDNIEVAIKMAGYHKMPQKNQDGQANFVKLVSKTGYPRFHIYLAETKTEYVFTLHLDQKKPVYQGATAHSGEYDNDILQAEAKKVKNRLSQP